MTGAVCLWCSSAQPAGCRGSAALHYSFQLSSMWPPPPVWGESSLPPSRLFFYPAVWCFCPSGCTTSTQQQRRRRRSPEYDKVYAASHHAHQRPSASAGRRGGFQSTAVFRDPSLNRTPDIYRSGLSVLPLHDPALLTRPPPCAPWTASDFHFLSTPPPPVCFKE